MNIRRRAAGRLAVAGALAVCGVLIPTAIAGADSTYSIPSTAPSVPAGDTLEPTGISCGAVASCVATTVVIDSGSSSWGGYFEETNGSWGAVHVLPQSIATIATTNSLLTAVSCATAGNCTAVGLATVSGQTLPIYLTETNGQWSAPAFLDQPTGDETPEAISCWSAGECVAVGYSYSQNSGHTNAISYRISQGTITKAVLPDAGVANSDATSVSCWGPEHCVAVGALFPTIGATKATAFRYDASAGWTGPFTLSSSVTDSFTYSRIQSISCLSDGTCQTVGAVGSPPPVSSRRAGSILRIQGVHATFDSSGWNNVALLDGNGTAAVTDPTDVSCWTSESCVAIGSTGAFGVGAPRRGTPRNVELLPANNVHGISWGQAGGQWGSIGVSSTFKYFNGISCVGGTCTVVGINNSGVVVSLMTTLLTFTSTSLPNASLGSGYHQPIATLGGEGIATVAQTGGTLPRGISFDPATGALQGTATEMGTFTFTLTASSTGNLPQTASFTYTLVVGPALAATGLNLPLLFGSGMFLLAIGVYLRRRFGRIA